jgi:S-DNA-T family DNA segregation ATPase FtsK/SpoIIIE
MPHLMIAGSTNTGKSVSVNSVLTALLYQNSPEELKFIMVDPKRVELSFYNGIPHLLTPVIVDASKVISALKWAVSEMERRYKVLQDIGSKDIHSYNKKVAQGKKNQVLDEETGKYEYEELEKMPFIIIVIDELADLMASHGKEVEGAIVRLAQMSRAVGIHLIISTQRPSVEVITGLIKANITTRIAFQVATQIDSRTILDMAGAEKLLGNGDLLFSSVASSKPRRIQGVFISEEEIRKVVKFIKKQAKDIDFDGEEDLSGSLEEQLESSMGVFSGAGTVGEKDEELFEEAKHIVIENKKASTSLLQRKLSIGYSRAARLMDMLEESGVVGPADGTKPRQILIATGDVVYDDDSNDQQRREGWK